VNVIQLEHVGKRYWLRHRAPDRRLMEVLHDGLSSAGGLFTGRKSARPAAGEEFWALQDVSLEIQAGEVVGLIGRNGAGKSTLLKLISWIMAPTTGRVGVRGRMGCLLEVGSGFHPELTGRENVFLNGAILGMSRKEIRRKFDQIVSFAEVEAFLDTPVKHYSSGMFVRLAFAVAAMLEPEILIVDEVLSVGDASFQKKALGAIQDAVARGTTCLLVSHHLPSVVSLCQRAVLLEQGRIVADGEPDDVVRRYLATAASTGGQARWDDPATAPGNEEVRLVSVEVSQPSSESPTARIELSEEIRIAITYKRRTEGPPVSAALLLKDSSGTAVLLTESGRGRETRAELEGRGRETRAQLDENRAPLDACGFAVRETCLLPARLLNEGRYSVTAIIGRGVQHPLATAADCISFDVHDTRPDRGPFTAHWPGVIRPELPWTREDIACGSS
jgi:lipopolysaccharide transport system ATP-binding protein